MQTDGKHWYSKWWGIILIIVLVFILSFMVAIGFYIFNLVKQINDSEANKLLSKPSLYQDAAIKKLIESRDNYWLGSAKPKITIVEFADYNCSLCKNSYSKIREISIKYKEDVKIIHRDYPILDYSADLSLAARCVGEQGLFWLMHDKLFQNQGNFDIKDLPELANQVGADIDRYNKCIQTKKYLSDIQKDFSDGNELGIKGTPTWFINGYKIEGDIPYNIFIDIINQFLN